LAAPETLGVSIGASLGAMIAITLLPPVAVAGISAVAAAGFLRSLGALAGGDALSVARGRGVSSPLPLLGGGGPATFLWALVTFIQSLADFTKTFQMVRWLMGSLDVGGYSAIVASLVPMALAGVGYATLPRTLDLITLGPDAAAARGVDVARAERVALVTASL